MSDFKRRLWAMFTNEIKARTLNKREERCAKRGVKAKEKRLMDLEVLDATTEPRVSYIDNNNNEVVLAGEDALSFVAALEADTVVSPEAQKVAALPRIPEK